MACGSCSKRRADRSRAIKVEDSNRDLFGNYKYLSNQQIEARLSAYKRTNCKECDKRYDCNYTSFLACPSKGV